MRRSTTVLALFAALTLLASACGGGDQLEGGGNGGSTESAGSEGGEVTAGSEALDGASIAVGSKDFDEQQVLGYISVTALEAAGANVEDQINLGGTDANRQALTSGQIQHYWEYTGTGWINHLGNTDPIPDRDEQYNAVKDQDLEENNLVWLAPAPFNNTYGLAFRSEAAGDLGNPETLSDLSDLIENNPDQATLCVETEFESREDGLPGMEETYGYEFPQGGVTGLDTGVIYSAIDKGDPCNFGEIFTTDGRISALDLTVLEDDEAFFPLYNASPVFTRDVYEQYGEALEACFGPIAEALTQEEMTELNKRVSSDGERPQAVAESFVNDNDLLGGCESG